MSLRDGAAADAASPSGQSRDRCRFSSGTEPQSPPLLLGDGALAATDSLWGGVTATAMSLRDGAMAAAVLSGSEPRPLLCPTGTEPRLLPLAAAAAGFPRGLGDTSLSRRVNNIFAIQFVKTINFMHYI